MADEQKPLSVAIAVLIKEDEILLIKRKKADYIGYWALPGGKIKHNEHVSEAAIRELKEETGIDADFLEYCGLVSERLIDGAEQKHFLLNLCLLKLNNADYPGDHDKKWFSLSKLESYKEIIIPSDMEMIYRMVKNKEKNYFDCVIEKDKDQLHLKKFK